MGCFSSKISLERSGLPSWCELGFKKECLLELEKGGYLIKTSFGFIQHGIPPETVKDSIKYGKGVPRYYILPLKCFDWKTGVNLIEFEFPVYYNYFLKNQLKTRLLCNKETEERVRKIFRETLLGPESFENYKDDFVKNYKAIPNIELEIKHFSKKKDSLNDHLKIDDFIEFMIFNNEGVIEIEEGDGKVIVSRVEGNVYIRENGEILGSFSDTIKPRKENYSVFDSMKNYEEPIFDIPEFGITVLGSSHGFDVDGITSGMVVWIGGEGIMIDPPTFSSAALKLMGISPGLITSVILTHCHADHDSGVIQKFIEEFRIELWTTETILNSFLRKYSAITDTLESDLRGLFDYKRIKIGHCYSFNNSKITFNYSFHSIPTLCFTIEYKNKSIFFSGDTFYDKEELNVLFKKGLFSEERYTMLSEVDFERFDLILHEAGIPPIHTPISSLANLPKSIKDRLLLYHIAQDVIPVDSGLKVASLGLRNTVILETDKITDQDLYIRKLKVIAKSFFNSYLSGSQLIEAESLFQLERYDEGSVVINEGDFVDKLFIVASGILNISSQQKKIKSKLFFQGDFFGESSIIDNSIRNATVTTLTSATLYSIEAKDFLYLYENQIYGSNYQNPIKRLTSLFKNRNNNFTEYFVKNSIFESFTENQLSLLGMLFEPFEVKKGTMIIDLIEDPVQCFLLIRGKIRISPEKENRGKSIIVNCSGNFLGSFEKISGKGRYNYRYVEFIGDSELLKIGQDETRELFDRVPILKMLIKGKVVLE